MYDNIGACSHNQCCSGNATVLSVCVQLCHYQWHRSIYSFTTMRLWQIYVMGKSTVYVVHIEWLKLIETKECSFAHGLWTNTLVKQTVMTDKTLHSFLRCHKAFYKITQN